MLGTKTTMSTSRSKWFLKGNQLVHVSIGIPPRGHDRTKRIRKERYKRMVGLTTVFEKKSSKILFQIFKDIPSSLRYGSYCNNWFVPENNMVVEIKFPVSLVGLKSLV